VVCNLQITKRLETFYVNRGKPRGRFKAKVFDDFFFFVWVQSTYAFLAEIIKFGPN
jgi:hypothetical protein